MLRRRLFFGVALLLAGLTGALAQNLTVSSISASPSQAAMDAAVAANLATMDQRIQASTVTLNSSGVATWTYLYPYAAPPVVSYMAIGDGGAYPVQCNFTSVTASTAVIKCYKGASAAISLALLPLSLNAFQGVVTGTVVHLHARPLTT